MSNQIKIARFFIVSVSALVFGLNSAWAQTSYNFSQTFNVNGTDEVFTGIFTTNTGSGAQAITGWSNLTFGPVGTNYTATYIGTGGQVGPNTYDASTGALTAQPMFTSSYVTNPVMAGGNWSLYQNWDSMMLGQMSYIYAYDGSGGYSGYNAIAPATITVSSGAPEIDGKILPQALMLIGGACLLYVRRKPTLHITKLKLINQ